MIVAEYVESNSRIRHYSDAGMLIKQVETGNIYEDAVDSLPCKFTYEETNTPIPADEEPTIEEKAAAYDVLMGGNEDDDS